MSNNSTFKVFFQLKDKKVVLTRGKFTENKDFDALRDKIVNQTNKPAFKAEKKTLKTKDIFVLKFESDNPFIPSNLDSIWDQESYDFFLEKITNRKMFEDKFKFLIEKRNDYPEMKPLNYTEVVEKAIKETWDKIEKELKSEISLVKLEDTNKKYEELKDKIAASNKKWNEEHKDVICNNCLKKNFTGIRFICNECNNYNLCAECEKNLFNEHFHNLDHIFIRCNKPINEDVMKFNNIISPKEIVCRNIETCYTIKFTIINTGENNLKKCYIAPIKFGNENLNCKPVVIEEDLERNESQEIEMIIRRNQDMERGIFHGYFRMFTSEGLPFGRILDVKNIVGE